jgi:hypothetical protein
MASPPVASGAAMFALSYWGAQAPFLKRRSDVGHRSWSGNPLPSDAVVQSRLIPSGGVGAALPGLILAFSYRKIRRALRALAGVARASWRVGGSSGAGVAVGRPLRGRCAVAGACCKDRCFKFIALHFCPSPLHPPPPPLTSAVIFVVIGLAIRSTVLVIVMLIPTACFAYNAFGYAVEEQRVGIAVTGTSAKDATLIATRLDKLESQPGTPQTRRRDEVTLLVTSVNVGSVERIFLKQLSSDSTCGTTKRIGALFGVLHETAGNPVLLCFIPLPNNDKQGSDDALLRRIAAAIARLTGRPIGVGQIPSDAEALMTVAGPLSLDGQVMAERLHPYDPQFEGGDMWTGERAAPISPLPVVPVAFSAGAADAHGSGAHGYGAHGSGAHGSGLWSSWL